MKPDAVHSAAFSLNVTRLLTRTGKSWGIFSIPTSKD